MVSTALHLEKQNKGSDMGTWFYDWRTEEAEAEAARLAAEEAKRKADEAARIKEEERKQLAVINSQIKDHTPKAPPPPPKRAPSAMERAANSLELARQQSEAMQPNTQNAMYGQVEAVSEKFKQSQEFVRNSSLKYGKNLNFKEYFNLVKYGVATYVFNKEKNAIDIVPLDKDDGMAYSMPIGYIDMDGKYRPYKYTKADTIQPNKTTGLDASRQAFKQPIQSQVPITEDEYFAKARTTARTTMKAPMDMPNDIMGLNKPITRNYALGKSQSGVESFAQGLASGIDAPQRVAEIISGTTSSENELAKAANPDEYGYGRTGGDMALAIASGVATGGMATAVGATAATSAALGGGVAAIFSNLDNYKMVGNNTMSPHTAVGVTLFDALANTYGYNFANKMRMTTANFLRKSEKAYTSKVMTAFNEIIAGKAPSAIGAAPNKFTSGMANFMEKNAEPIVNLGQNFLGSTGAAVANAGLRNLDRVDSPEELQFSRGENVQQIMTEVAMSVAFGTVMDMVTHGLSKTMANIAAKQTTPTGGEPGSAVPTMLETINEFRGKDAPDIDPSTPEGLVELLTDAITFAKEYDKPPQGIVTELMGDLLGKAKTRLSVDEIATIHAGTKILEDAMTVKPKQSEVEAQAAAEQVAPDVPPQDAGITPEEIVQQDVQADPAPVVDKTASPTEEESAWAQSETGLQIATALTKKAAKKAALERWDIDVEQDAIGLVTAIRRTAQELGIADADIQAKLPAILSDTPMLDPVKASEIIDRGLENNTPDTDPAIRIAKASLLRDLATKYSDASGSTTGAGIGKINGLFGVKKLDPFLNSTKGMSSEQIQNLFATKLATLADDPVALTLSQSLMPQQVVPEPDPNAVPPENVGDIQPETDTPVPQDDAIAGLPPQDEASIIEGETPIVNEQPTPEEIMANEQAQIEQEVVAQVEKEVAQAEAVVEVDEAVRGLDEVLAEVQTAKAQRELEQVVEAPVKNEKIKAKVADKKKYSSVYDARSTEFKEMFEVVDEGTVIDEGATVYKTRNGGTKTVVYDGHDIPDIIYKDAEGNAINPVVNAMRDTKNAGREDEGKTLDSSTANLRQTYDQLKTYLDDVVVKQDGHRAVAAEIVMRMLKANPESFGDLKITLPKPDNKYSGKIAGQYKDGEIVIRTAKSVSPEIDKLLHEMGHAVHDLMPDHIFNEIYPQFAKSRKQAQQDLPKFFAKKLKGLLPKAEIEIYIKEYIHDALGEKGAKKYNPDKVARDAYEALGQLVFGKDLNSDTVVNINDIAYDIFDAMYTFSHHTEWFANQMARWAKHENQDIPDKFARAPAWAKSALQWFDGIFKALKGLKFETPQSVIDGYQLVMSGEKLYRRGVPQSENAQAADVKLKSSYDGEGEISYMKLPPPFFKAKKTAAKKIEDRQNRANNSGKVQINEVNRQRVEGSITAQEISRNAKSPEEADKLINDLWQGVDRIFGENGAFNDILGIGTSGMFGTGEGKGIDKVALIQALQGKNAAFAMTELQLNNVFKVMEEMSHHTKPLANLSPKYVQSQLSKAAAKTQRITNYINDLHSAFHNNVPKEVQDAIWNVNDKIYRALKYGEQEASGNPITRQVYEKKGRADIASPEKIKAALADYLKEQPASGKKTYNAEELYAQYEQFRDLMDEVTKLQARQRVETSTNMDFEYVLQNYKESLQTVKDYQDTKSKINAAYANVRRAYAKLYKAAGDGKAKKAINQQLKGEQQRKNAQLLELETFGLWQDKAIVQSMKWYNDFVGNSMKNMYVNEHGADIKKNVVDVLEPVHWDATKQEWASSVMTSKSGGGDNGGFVLRAETEDQASKMFDSFMGEQGGNLYEHPLSNGRLYQFKKYDTKGNVVYEADGKTPVMAIYRRKPRVIRQDYGVRRREIANKVIKAITSAEAANNTVTIDMDAVKSAMDDMRTEMISARKDADIGNLTESSADEVMGIDELKGFIEKTFKEKLDDGGIVKMSALNAQLLTRQLAYLMEVPSTGLRLKKTDLYHNVKWAGWHEAKGTTTATKVPSNHIKDTVNDARTAYIYQNQRLAIRRAISDQLLTMSEIGVSGHPYAKYLAELMDRAERMPWQSNWNLSMPMGLTGDFNLGRVLSYIGGYMGAKNLMVSPKQYISNRKMNIAMDAMVNALQDGDTFDFAKAQFISNISQMPTDLLKVGSKLTERWKSRASENMREMAEKWELDMLNNPVLREAYRLAREGSVMGETTAQNAAEQGGASLISKALLFTTLAEKANRRATFLTSAMRYMKQHPPELNAKGDASAEYYAALIAAADMDIKNVDGSFDSYHMGATLSHLNSSAFRPMMQYMKPLGNGLSTYKLTWDAIFHNMAKQGMANKFSPGTMKAIKGLALYHGISLALGGVANELIVGDLAKIVDAAGTWILNDEDVDEVLHERFGERVERRLREGFKNAGYGDGTYNFLKKFYGGVLNMGGYTTTSDETLQSAADAYSLQLASDLYTFLKEGSQKYKDDNFVVAATKALADNFSPPPLLRTGNAIQSNMDGQVTYNFGKNYYNAVPTIASTLGYLAFGTPSEIRKEQEAAFSKHNTLETQNQRETFIKQLFASTGVKVAGTTAAGETKVAQQFADQAKDIRSRVREISEGYLPQYKASEAAIEAYVIEHWGEAKNKLISGSTATTAKYSIKDVKNQILKYNKDFWLAHSATQGISEVLQQNGMTGVSIEIENTLPPIENEMSGYDYAIEKYNQSLTRDNNLGASGGKRRRRPTRQRPTRGR